MWIFANKNIGEFSETLSETCTVSLLPSSDRPSLGDQSDQVELPLNESDREVKVFVVLPIFNFVLFPKIHFAVLI